MKELLDVMTAELKSAKTTALPMVGNLKMAEPCAKPAV